MFFAQEDNYKLNLDRDRIDLAWLFLLQEALPDSLFPIHTSSYKNPLPIVLKVEHALLVVHLFEHWDSYLAG